MKTKLTYTFPANCRVAALAGKTVVGGEILKLQIDRKLVDVVRFETLFEGKNIIARIAGKPELEAALAEKEAEQAKKYAVAQAEKKAFEATLEGQREALRIAESDSYSENHYPGSRAWMANQAARKALDAFDAAHPEIANAFKVARAAKAKADYDALSDFVKCGS